jgi:hypothetical protein
VIAREHLEQLLDRPDEEDARLIVVLGRALVVPADALREDRYRGALEIASRRNVAGRLGSESAASRTALDEVAAQLDTQLSQLGG